MEVMYFQASWLKKFFLDEERAWIWDLKQMQKWEDDFPWREEGIKSEYFWSKFHQKRQKGFDNKDLR